jgi:hypothetical protein
MSTWVERALEARENGHQSTQQPEATLGDRVPADRLITSVVDGNIEPEAMCPGSESRQVMFCGDRVQCSHCDRWLPAYPGSFLAPVHALPESWQAWAGEQEEVDAFVQLSKLFGGEL